jgi:hypothetical protein
MPLSWLARGRDAERVKEKERRIEPPVCDLRPRAFLETWRPYGRDGADFLRPRRANRLGRAFFYWGERGVMRVSVGLSPRR